MLKVQRLNLVCTLKLKRIIAYKPYYKFYGYITSDVT